MTLTEMLYKAINDTPPESQPEKEANFYELECIKKVFKQWLKEVGLPDYFSINRDGKGFNATESIRQLLITLVDEPDPFEVHCGNCNWWGKEEQLKPIYKLNPHCPDDVITEAGCPVCMSDQYLEYKENRQSSMDNLYRAVLNLSEKTDQFYNALIEIGKVIKCLTSQQPKSEKES